MWRPMKVENTMRWNCERQVLTGKSDF